METRTKLRLAALIVFTLLVFGVATVVLAAADLYVDPTGSDSGNCQNPVAPCKTITYAISQAASGDIIHLAAGAYAEAPNINKSLTILGAGEATTLINTNASAGYGLNSNGDYAITLKDFSIDGPPSATQGYGLKLSGDLATAVIENVTVYSSGRSGFDLNGLNSATLTNITATGNGGVGLALSNCSNVTVSGVTTSGNTWGGVGIFTSAVYPGGSDNITITGVNSFGEPNPLYAQEIGFPITNVHVNSVEFPYIVYNPVSAPGSWGYQQSAANAVLAATSLPSPGASYIVSTADGSLLVGPGMSIQTAINAADPGDTVNVLAGTYIENANTWRDMYITKSLSLIGAGSGSTIIQLNQSKTNGLEIYGSGLSVTIQGITFDKLPINSYGPGFAIRAGESASSFTSLVFRDVEVAYASGRNIFLDNNGTFSSVTLDQCNIHHSGAWGFSQAGQLNSLTVTDSHFDNNGSSDPAHGIGFDLGPTTGATATNITVTGSTFNNNTAKGINLLKTSNATFTGFTANNNSGAPGGGFGVSLWEWAGTSTNLTFSNANLSSNSTDGFLFGAENGTTISNVTINNSILTNNGRNGVLIYRAAGWAEGTISNITINNNNVSGNTSQGIGYSYPNTTVQATCNWWGHVSGPSYAGNPGGLGAGTTSNITYSPWLIYATDTSGDPGWQFPTSFTVTAGGDISAADNNYRSLGNAIGCVQSGQTINLSGAFDFTATYAYASWQLGNDADASTGLDNWEVDVPPSDDVTLTAASLGAATIQGPGDVPTVDLEGFLQFYNAGTNHNWTISNLQILDFDLSIGMFYGGGSPSHAYQGVTIENNYIRMATDLKGASSSGPEDFQNIAIHLAYGKNQTIRNNTIDVPGDGLSDATSSGYPDWWTYGVAPGWLFSSNVVLQSNTHGGDSYDGLLIDNNTIQILNAQSAYPQRIIGIWENGWAHTSDITVSNNQFLNLAAGNNPALNRQMAFRPTSHGSATTTVLYDNNTSDGAAIAYAPMNMSSAPAGVVNITNGLIRNALHGIILGNYERFAISLLNMDNDCSLSSTTGIELLTSAQATITDVTLKCYTTGLLVNGGTATVDNTRFLAGGTGVQINSGTADLDGGNLFVGNTSYGVNNLSATPVDAENNFWGNCDGPGPVGPGSGDNISTNVDYDPWMGQSGDPVDLQALIDAAAPGDTIQLGVCTYNGAYVWKPLTIQGVPGTVIMNGPGPVLWINGNNTTIQNLTIDLTGFSGTAIATYQAVNNLVIKNLEIFGGGGGGIQIDHAINNLQIVDNFIHDLVGDAVQYNAQVTGVHEVQGNLFQNNGGYGVNNTTGYTYDVTYNSWGHLLGPVSGDGANGPLITTPFTHVGMGMTSSGTPTANVVGVGGQIIYTIWMDAANVYGADFDLSFNNSLVSVVSITDLGAFSSHPGLCKVSTVSEANTSGVISFCGFRTSGPLNGAAQGVYQVVLQGVTPGTTALNLDELSDRFSMVPPSGASTNIYAAALTDGTLDIMALFTVNGRIDLQGRSNDTGAQMTLVLGSLLGYGPYPSTVTDYWGNFTISNIVGPDTYSIIVQMDRYLDVTLLSLKTVLVDAAKTLNTLVLWGGDANHDDAIDVLDATIVGSDYGNSGGGISDPDADINNDGVVDILDMVLVGGNYGKISDSAYSSWTP